MSPRLPLALSVLLAACVESPSPGGCDSGDQALATCITPDSSSPSGGGCDPGADGDLVIELPELGLDWPATAVVLDPSGAEIARLTESATLVDLPGGTYRVVAERGIRYAPGSAVDTALGALHDTALSVCVGGGPATVTLPIEPQPSSGRLWVSAGETLAAFSAETLRSAGEIAADARLEVGLVNDFRGMSFDPSGNLWVATAPTYGTRLLMFRPDQLDGFGEQQAALEIPVGDDGEQLADLWVDPSGTVWALVRFSYRGFAGLLGWSRADLLEAIASGGRAEIPPSTVHAMPELAGAEDLLAAGDDLFVSVFDQNRVFRYSRGRLSGTMNPEAELWFVDDLDIEQTGPTEMALAGDRIWLVLWTAPRIVHFSPTDQGPIRMDPLSAEVTDLPAGMDADASGTVWWGNLALSGEAELHPLDGASGAPGESRIAAGLVSPADLLFDPPAR